MDSADKILTCLGKGTADVHFSQWGEDVVLWHYLRLQRDGFYVDVGAHHPERLSNTALLHYRNGWSGINIEPDERLYQAFLQARPNDINLCCGVGADNGFASMGVFEDGAVNSFDVAAVEFQIQHGGKRLAQYRDIEVRKLCDILDEYMPPGRQIDLLSVDVEGWEISVLESNDWGRYKPPFIAVEDHKMVLARAADSLTFQLLNEKGYRLVAHTIATSIYVCGR